MKTPDIDTADWLDAALAAAGKEHRAAYVADDGFTARVIGRLPAAPTLPAWRWLRCRAPSTTRSAAAWPFWSGVRSA